MTKTLNSFRFAFSGIFHLFRTQLNARIHLAVLFLVITAGFVLEVSETEWIWLILASGFVLASEAFNTAIETLTDLVSPQFNEKAGKVKDLAAGAVLLAAVTAIATGLIIFIPKLL